MPTAAKKQRAIDRRGVPAEDPGTSPTIEKTGQWLCRAQDQSTSADGGVSRDFSLVSGWSPSYPETTGYIVPTFFALDERFPGAGYRDRAARMLDWLVDIQLDSGAYQGGMVTSDPVPVTFNTGQILLGLAAGVRVLGDQRYDEAMHKASQWLATTQDDDGCWRRFATPFAAPGEKTYETHVAWGLLEADRAAPGNGYGEAGLRQIRWAMTKIQPNGWVADCCLTDPTRPLTHTLGYALRGIVEGYRFSGDSRMLEAAEQLARGLLSAVDDDGRLPGRLTQTGNRDWVEAALALNRFVRRTVRLDGHLDVAGAVGGSFPIDGAYGRYEYLNWAAKFLIDALMMEEALLASEDAGERGPDHGGTRRAS